MIRIKSFVKKVFFVFVYLACVGLFLEVALRGAALVHRDFRRFSAPYTPQNLNDDVWIYRPNPAYWEHDPNGFRNRRIPRQSDIVVLGDSMTYGVNGSREDAWPMRLSALSGISVYNMSFSGFAPAHALHYLPKALALKPKLVLQAVYLGNDFVETYMLVYERGTLPELATKDPVQLAALQKLASETDVVEELSDLMHTAMQAIHHPPRRAAGLKMKLEQTCALYNAVRLVRNYFRYGPSLAPPLTPPTNTGQKELVFFADPPGGTVFTPLYRLTALDLDNPRVAGGLDSAMIALERERDEVTKAGAAFAVVIIPTKEVVFQPLLRNEPEILARLQKNIDAEDAVMARVVAALRDKGIAVIDLSPSLQAAVAMETGLYPYSSDDHPLPKGYQAFAEAVWEALQHQNLLPRSSDGQDS